MFRKILIANRGEIACRVINTARRLGVATVAVYSDADRNARHVRLADEAVHIGGAAPAESYLVGERILAAAKQTGAEAIHPGYGFLSENAGFADACAAADVVFIGPPADAIRAMGSKSAAKALMGEAGVPLTPGYHGDEQDPAFLQARADEIGYPVLIKASAGGGGKGMRRVDDAAGFEDALTSCRREAASAFGDDHVLVEKFVVEPRHIEIQVFGDTHGNAVYLFERDCSVQRRHQKVLEEAPAPGMTAERRAAMGQAAVDAARAVGYVGAGTVEFIANQDGSFYFMEMNTRLQVEHPVTEMITGLDLVEWQLRVAAGEPLPLAQDAIPLDGHAIEARIYAEDPDGGFLPSIGTLSYLAPPADSAHVRVDTGVEQGDEITPNYDPMIAKLIVWDRDRDAALERLVGALEAFHIVGVRNNVGFLRRLALSPSFSGARLDTALIEREEAFLFQPRGETPRAALLAAAVAEALAQDRAVVDGSDDPWSCPDDWRVNGAASRPFEFLDGEASVHVDARRDSDALRLTHAGGETLAHCHRHDGDVLELGLDGHRMSATVVPDAHQRHVFVAGEHYTLEYVDPLAAAGEHDEGDAGLLAPMPGKVIAIIAESGQTVSKGDPLLVLEAMKMEHTICAPADGVVKSFYFAANEQVVEGAELVEFEAS
ncbi:MAG: acetyl/propionyl/methylcrotonyl-CoA carboxylase subunit alpha [Gammaproteobacteria bacterium]